MVFNPDLINFGSLTCKMKLGIVMRDFIDNENGEEVDKTTVQRLMQMLDQYSALAMAFRMARDRCRSHTSLNVELKLLSDRTNA
ncbi:hypothetical protein Tco_1155538 [Tanacetum coccineum]